MKAVGAGPLETFPGSSPHDPGDFFPLANLRPLLSIVNNLWITYNLLASYMSTPVRKLPQVIQDVVLDRFQKASGAEVN